MASRIDWASSSASKFTSSSSSRGRAGTASDTVSPSLRWHSAKQCAGAETAPAAHGDDGELQIRTFQLVHRLGNEHRAGATEWVAKGDRTTIGVHAIQIRLKPLLPGHHPRSEAFVLLDP